MDEVAQQPRMDADRVLEQQIEAGPDLVHLHRDVLTFLSDIHEHAVTDAALVVVMLTGDAFRYGAPPVTLRLKRSPDDRSLRVEVDDHRSAGADAIPEDYRVNLLDRMTTARGAESDHGITTTWAEIPLTPTSAR
jgi:hypothetical protein